MSKKKKSKRQSSRISPQEPSLVTCKNITPEEISFLTDSQTLREWAPLSILVRCGMFHRKFPDRRISAKVLNKVMSQCGLKKKKIKVINVPQRKSDRKEEFEDKILQLDTTVKRIQEQGGHLVFCDECIFTARGFQTHAWSKPGENIVVEDRTGRQPCQAVCAGVCSCH